MARVPIVPLLSALGVGGAGVGGYAIGKSKQKKRTRALASKAGAAIQGQRRLIVALMRQNNAMRNAFVSQRRQSLSRKGG